VGVITVLDDHKKSQVPNRLIDSMPVAQDHHWGVFEASKKVEITGCTGYITVGFKKESAR
jgi:hypothetical protein